jgi:hypothetical protein
VSGVALAKPKKANWRLKQVKAVAPKPKADRSGPSYCDQPAESFPSLREERPGEN